MPPTAPLPAHRAAVRTQCDSKSPSLPSWVVGHAQDDDGEEKGEVDSGEGPTENRRDRAGGPAVRPRSPTPAAPASCSSPPFLHVTGTRVCELSLRAADITCKRVKARSYLVKNRRSATQLGDQHRAEDRLILNLHVRFMCIILIGALYLNSELTWKQYETTEETQTPTLHLMY